MKQTRIDIGSIRREQIVEALDSPDPDIRYEAVCAAGSWAVGAAWTRGRDTTSEAWSAT